MEMGRQDASSSESGRFESVRRRLEAEELTHPTVGSAIHRPPMTCYRDGTAAAARIRREIAI